MNPSLEDRAALYVLDELDARERAEFEAQRRRDPQLDALVRDLEAALEHRVRSLPQHEPPAGLLARIEGRMSRSSAPPARSPSWATAARWAIAAVIAISAATVAIQSLRRPAAAPAGPTVVVVALEADRSTLAVLPLQERPPNADAGFVQLASLAERYWEKPDQLPGQSADTGKGGHGYALFDLTNHQGFIAIRRLPTLEPDKSYRLWLVDTASGQAREVGTLPLAGSTGGLYSFAVAPAAGTNPARVNFFVTAEDRGAAPTAQPRGKVVLGERRM